MRRPCLEPRCPRDAKNRGRCSAHARVRDKGINRAGRNIYSTKQWKILRRMKLRLNPICERCDNELATDVHHKHGVEANPWSVGGLESLCHSCHSQETRRTQLVGEGR